MRAESYRLVVASILYSEQDKRVGCRPYELLEYLRQAVKYGDEEHNAIVFEVEHLTRFAIELRLSCETAHNFFVVLQQEGSDERRFRAEHYLEANPPENYVLDLGESTRRSLTICRVDDEGSSRTVSFSSDTALPGNTLTSHKIHKSNSFLKRLRRKCSGSVYQILLSHCRLNAWNQHSLSTIVPNSVITFRILRISKGLPCHDMIIKSEEIANDFCELTKCIAETDAELQCERSQSREYDGGLGDAGDAILDHSIKFSGLPHIYRRLIILCVLLEWSHKEISLSERAIPLAITQLRTSSHLDVDLCSPMSARLSLAAKRFIKNTLHFDHTVKFFPPIQHSPVANFTRRIELAVSIRNLELWRHFPLQSPVDTFRCELQGIIEVEVNSWVKQCESDLPNAVRSLTNSLSFFSDSYISLFGYFDISYIGVVFATLDQKLSKKGTRFVRRALRSLDTHNDESLESFTKATMKLFEGFKNLIKVAKEARVKDGELFSYESWFTASAVFWTFTWRTMCRRLTLRSLAEDNEGICDERVLPSVVNFLAIHKALCEDFIHLELQNANLALMCVFKIALTIADDLLIYSKRMHAASGSFDSTKRMLAANSIEHACNFVKNSTARLLNVDTLSAVLPPNEFRQANASISQILSNAVEQCKGLAISIVTALCKERCEAVAKYCHAITQYAVKGRKNLVGGRIIFYA
uniref:C2 domain-containing protein n=1 Tax=Parascaris univalens TaxID=6257 RepID=A0A915BG11_PARUN